MHNRSRYHPLKTSILICWISLISACVSTVEHNVLSEGKDLSSIAQANLNLGIAYLRQEEFEKALQAFEKAREADPKNPSSYNMLGVLHQRIDRFQEAEKYYKQALSLDKDNPNTLNNYGQFLCSQKRPERAQEAFLKATENPFYTQPEIAFTNAGICAARYDQNNEAEEFFRTALQINPNVVQALLHMTTLNYQKEQYLAARAYLQRYQELAAHTAKSLWLGIRIEKELGDKNILSSYALRLKNDFADSDEAKLLLESGLR